MKEECYYTCTSGVIEVGMPHVSTISSRRERAPIFLSKGRLTQLTYISFWKWLKEACLTCGLKTCFIQHLVEYSIKMMYIQLENSLVLKVTKANFLEVRDDICNRNNMALSER